jgi:hypothetical protein
VGHWVKFKRSVKTPAYGWQGARHGSVGFVQCVQNSDSLVVSFCTGVAHVLANEVIKVIALDRGQLVRLKANIEKPRFDTSSLNYCKHLVLMLHVLSFPCRLSHCCNLQIIGCHKKITIERNYMLQIQQGIIYNLTGPIIECGLFLHLLSFIKHLN